MSLPDFLIVGAMKCGTTTLQAQLSRQDGVFMSTPKEPNFFSNDENYARGLDWYESLFDDAAATDLKGEASTHYTKLPTYPETLSRLQPVLPNAKIIYVIRNPVERAVSHYIHEWTEAHVSNDITEAFQTESEFRDYGCYAKQIAPYVEAYGIENVLLSCVERLSAAPDEEFKRIAEFLGLGPSAAWQHDMKPQNVSRDRFRRIPLQGLLIDHPFVRKLRHMLVPIWLRRKIRTARQIKTRPEVPVALQDRLEQEFLKDRSDLATLFPGNPALDLCYPFQKT